MGTIFNYLLLIFFYLNIIACNRINGTETGIILDTVRCNNNPMFSYALYLPKNYHDSVKWPVIFVFDPGARGKSALTNFVQAAGKYGFILAGSNNSKNGIPGEMLSDIINTMTADVESNYSIDPERIYTSGFSGGSRVASLIALNSGNVAGVIACGAGLPVSVNDIGIQNFDYYGLVGDRDMNYLEMTDLINILDSLGIHNTIDVFDGGHEWPSPGMLQSAIEWMELRAMQKGTKQRNPEFINSLIEDKKNQAEILLDKGELLESVKSYQYICDWSPDSSISDKIKKLSDSIQQTKNYKRAFTNQNEILIKECMIQQTLIAEMRQIASLEILSDSLLNWWSTEIGMLNRLKSGNDVYKQKMASRQMNFLAVASYETARNYIDLKRYKTAAIFYKIASMVQPENYNVCYMLARSYAFDKDIRNSLKYLERAVKMGYNNRKAIEDEKAFVSLFEEKKLKEIMEQIK